MCSCPSLWVCFCVLCGCIHVYCVRAVCTKTNLFQLCFPLSSICSFITSSGDRDLGSRLHISQLQHTMGSLRSSHCPLILVYMLLLQIQSDKVQGVDPMSQKLRRLNEQVRLNPFIFHSIYMIVMLFI